MSFPIQYAGSRQDADEWQSQKIDREAESGKCVLVGQIVGRWTILSEATADEHGRSRFVCRCSCGSKRTVGAYQLKNGHTMSCGCLVKDQMRAKKTTHSMSNTKEWRAWSGMKQRCINPRVAAYKHYGGRGISVCERWMQSFENFFLDMGFCPDGMSIDRIDNNGNYEPSNCRWASQIVQCRNQRKNVFLEKSGLKMTIGEWSKKLGLDKNTIHARLKRGLSVEKALV